MSRFESPSGPVSAFDSPTFGQDVSFTLDKPVGSASISPCGRDVVLASRQGLHIIDLDSPYSPPRHLPHHTPWEVADVQWSPFAARDYWVVSTSNQKALVWNLGMIDTTSSVEHVLHGHSRAITDINFSAHNPDILSTCAVDSFVHCWDLRRPVGPVMTFCDWFAGATQVKWNRQDPHILASSHDKFLRIWDDRKGAHPLRSIEAHATKIYGVDWSRTEVTSLATCSLDRTIKFWDYTSETNEPDHVIRTPFPIWRARHTPFGYGLLAMPQRGDHDLHLYDRRLDEDPQHITSAIHKFDGHNDQVKEFLWRPRGGVTENIDSRDFQLVSWGTDRMLRLHKISEEMLADVGYERGMETKRRVNFTRRNALYKTFREVPRNHTQDRGVDAYDNSCTISQVPVAGMRSALTIGMNKASVPFIGGYGNGGFMSPVITRKPATSTEIDPISWMRGVKIGRRNNCPSGMNQSISSILSPSFKEDSPWDVFESLGEEITHVGEKFAKVAFDEVDMTRRKITLSFTGPWGLEKAPTYIKTRIEFPSTYPDIAAPIVSLEKTASLSDDVVSRMNSEVSVITASFLSRQRGSLEAILRYILGEQTLEEILSSLKKRQESVDIDSTIELNISSSDDDDEAFEKDPGPRANDLESSDPMIVKPQAQNNPPVPKACGALWADDGRLVCFFPPKREKEASFLDLTLKASPAKGRNSIFEGFGRFHTTSRPKKRAPSTMETIESGDSDLSDSAYSSSASSSDSEHDLPRHHFMPGMAWRGDNSEAFPGITLDESQKSSSGMGKSKSMSSTGRNFVSIHDFTDLLPAKPHLARNYIVGHGSHGCAHNARAAENAGDSNLSDVWSLADLILQNKVPVELMNDAWSSRNAQRLVTSPILIAARRAGSRLKSKDSAIDLSYDMEEGCPTVEARAPIKWGDHPLGRRFLVDSLLCHYEHTADIQMLAMLSCVFDECHVPSDEKLTTSADTFSSLCWNDTRDYFPSEEVAKAHRHDLFSDPSSPIGNRKRRTGTYSADSTIGASQIELENSGTPQSNLKILHPNSERRDSQATSPSTSPEHLRHMNGSDLTVSASGIFASRSSSLSNAMAASPPNAFPRKRVSPVGNYLGTTTSASAWNPSHLFGRSSTITEDLTSSFTVSISDADENVPQGPHRPKFAIVLKNQDQIQNEGHARIPLLHRDQQRNRNYRNAYAHLLHIWGFPVARAEMLKYNITPTTRGNISVGTSASLPSASTTRHIETRPSSDDQHLGLRDHCTICTALSPYQSQTRNCPHCLAARAPAICLLCNTYIWGLSSPCLSCGHVLHTMCREKLFAQTDIGLLSECISGCGCKCSDHTTTVVDISATEVDEWSKTVQNQISPALTIVEAASVNEQEQLGWRDNSECEDTAAYESLARNLHPRTVVQPQRGQV